MYWPLSRGMFDPEWTGSCEAVSSVNVQVSSGLFTTQNTAQVYSELRTQFRLKYSEYRTQFKSIQNKEHGLG